MLVLRELTEKDETAFFEGMKEWTGFDPDWYTFTWKPGMAYSEMLDRLRKDRLGIELPENRVPHTMLYGFVDGVIVGRFSLRHQLNERLRLRGGHIGYSVAPKFRKRGYATEMVRQGLEHCRNLGLKEIMVTCADLNEPSCKIIEKFAGVLEDKIIDHEEDELIRRYWLKL